MSRRMLALAIATAVILTAGTTEVNAQPTSSKAPAVSAQSSKLIKTVRVRLDSNRSKDTVRIYRIGVNHWRVTAKVGKKRSSATFRTESEGDQPIDSPWVAWANLDGRKGAELILLSGAFADAVVHKVLTWRKGRLVNAPAPKSSIGKGWIISGGYGSYFSSYRFGRLHGRRIVDASNFSYDWEKNTYTGTITRSVWSSDRWRKLRQRNTTLSAAQAKVYWGKNGFAGVTLHG